MDDEGRFYDCYFCGNEGVVPEAVASEHYSSEAWARYVKAEAEIERWVKLNARRSDEDVWRLDDEREDRILAARTYDFVAAAPTVINHFDFDDIPF